MKRDSQRRRAYDFDYFVESILEDHGIRPFLNVEHAVSALEILRARFPIEIDWHEKPLVFKVNSKHTRGGSSYNPSEHLIEIASVHKRPHILCHEYAHAYAFGLYEFDHAWHGPEWMTVYMILLMSLLRLDPLLLIAGARKLRVSHFPEKVIAAAKALNITCQNPKDPQ